MSKQTRVSHPIYNLLPTVPMAPGLILARRETRA
jgi:hypothetical protein